MAKGMTQRKPTPAAKRAARTATSTISPALMAVYREDLAAHRAQLSAGLPPLEAAWGAFLQPHPWDWFVTLTFTLPVHPEQARKRYLRWITALERHPARRADGVIVWARGDELQRRGVLHHHVLLAGVDGIPIFAAINLWRHIGGGWAQIEPYNAGLGATFYIAKHGDVELSPVWFNTDTDNALNANSKSAALDRYRSDRRVGSVCAVSPRAIP